METWFCVQDLFWIWVWFKFKFCLWDKIIENVHWCHHPNSVQRDTFDSWICKYTFQLLIQPSTEGGGPHLSELFTITFLMILSHRQNQNQNWTQIQPNLLIKSNRFSDRPASIKEECICEGMWRAQAEARYKTCQRPCGTTSSKLLPFGIDKKGVTSFIDDLSKQE